MLNKRIFPIGLGAMPLSILNRPSFSDAINVIHHFVEMGGNLIDTANIYGVDSAHNGENESLIATAIKKMSIPKDIIISTKGGGTRPNNRWGLGGGDPVELRVACEASLLALDVDCITLYYLHGPDPKVPFEESIGELARLKQEGKIQHIGIANVNQELIKKAISVTEITAVQNRCNPFCKFDLREGVVNFCELNNIIYVPYCPLGGWYHHKTLIQDKLYSKLTQKYAVSPYVINLAWLLQKGENIRPIPGMDRIKQIDENIKSLALKLDIEDVLYIDSFPDKYLPTAS